MLYLNGIPIARDEFLGLDEEIFGRRTPKCPACAAPMDLIAETDGDGFTASYVCRTCRNWMTQPVKAKDIQVCSLAYRKAANQPDSCGLEVDPPRISLHGMLRTEYGGEMPVLEAETAAGDMEDPDADMPRTEEEWEAYYRKAVVDLDSET